VLSTDVSTLNLRILSFMKISLRDLRTMIRETVDLAKLKDTADKLSKDVSSLDKEEKTKLALAGAGETEAAVTSNVAGTIGTRGTTSTKSTKPTSTKPPAGRKPVDRKDFIEKLASFSKEVEEKRKAEKK
jgi:hypothetical protein